MRLTCAVFCCIRKQTENILNQPVLVRDDELTDFRRNGIDYDSGVRLKVVDAVHRNGEGCTL